MKSLIKYIILIFVSLTMIFPLFWMLLLSLKIFPEQYSNFFSILFSEYTLKNYIDTFSSDNFQLYFLNSIIVATSVTIANIFFCFFTGYALARREFRFKSLIFATVLGVLMIPPHIIMIPLYRIMVSFNWINTYYALIVPWIITPIGIFLVRQYVQSIPTELEQASRCDGASEWTTLMKIIFPICRPILTVIAIYIFLGNWNSFLFPFLFTNDTNYRTLPVGLAFYLGKQSIDWGHLMAGASISALPILFIFVIFQKQIINSLIAGALKEN